MDNYQELVQERIGQLSCFHLYHGETFFRMKDMHRLEENSCEDELLRLDSYKDLSEKAFYIVQLVCNQEDAIKFFSLFGRKFQQMSDIMEEWKKDRPRAFKKGIRLYLKKKEGWSWREIRETFDELSEFVSNL